MISPQVNHKKSNHPQNNPQRGNPRNVASKLESSFSRVLTLVKTPVAENKTILLQKTGKTAHAVLCCSFHDSTSCNTALSIFSLHRKSCDLHIFVPACENLWIEINHPDKKGIVIGVVYRLPQHDYSEFQEAFQKNILKINKSKKVFYACGDYNINLLQSDANHKIASYLKLWFILLD